MRHRPAQTQHICHLGRGVHLGSVEHVGARYIGLRQLVHLHVCSEGNDANQSVIRKIREILLKRVLETAQLFRIHSRVDHQKEDGGNALATLDFIFDCCIGRHHLIGEGSLVNSLSILRREVISLTTERASPELRMEVNLAACHKKQLYTPVRIQIRSTIGLSTANRLIRKCRWHSIDSLQRSISTY